MITVCIATHNGGKYINAQIDSILPQLKANDEVIISDDGSTDNTRKIIEEYASQDSRIKIFYFQQKEKHRLTSHELVSLNFENCIKRAKGEYIFLADQDDVWLPDKISKMLPELETHFVVISNAYIIRDNDLKKTNNYIYNDREPVKNYILRRGKYFGCCMAFRKEVLDIVLPFPKNLPLHDTFIGLSAEISGGAKYIDEPLIFYRIHGDNTSRCEKNTLLYKIWYRFRILFIVYSRLCLYFIRRLSASKL